MQQLKSNDELKQSAIDRETRQIGAVVVTLTVEGVGSTSNSSGEQKGAKVSSEQIKERIATLGRPWQQSDNP
jgi:DNA integrity scanning protein DisA with diadenylate cyclase activity